MLRVGLTGGIGSGKTTLGACFADLGAPVLDADQISRDLTRPGEPALSVIVDHFGKELLREGHLDRRGLRQRVFENPEDRQWLESLLHPLIYEEMDRQAAGLGGISNYVLLMVPLILETGRKGWVDRLLVVDVAPEIQCERLRCRDGMSETLMAQMLASQLSRNERLGLADDVISNAGTLECLRMQAESLHLRYGLLGKQRECRHSIPPSG